jgi:hypothetical protein
MLGDFDPENIPSLTHFVEEDRIKVRVDAVPDDVMTQTEESNRRRKPGDSVQDTV